MLLKAFSVGRRRALVAAASVGKYNHMDQAWLNLLDLTGHRVMPSFHCTDMITVKGHHVVPVNVALTVLCHLWSRKQKSARASRLSPQHAVPSSTSTVLTALICQTSCGTGTLLQQDLSQTQMSLGRDPELSGQLRFTTLGPDLKAFFTPIDLICGEYIF